MIPMDEWSGVGLRSITAGARRMLTLAGTSWSFDRASSHLKEFCHIQTSDDTIERVCQEEGERAKTWTNESNDPVEAFEKASGEAEFSADGVKINTVDQWREMRLSVLARREPSAACQPQDWGDRLLSEPTVRLSICAIANAERVGASWKSGASVGRGTNEDRAGGQWPGVDPADRVRGGEPGVGREGA
jgi:hypothetical protein